jgi:hypothetical protein
MSATLRTVGLQKAQFSDRLRDRCVLRDLRVKQTAQLLPIPTDDHTDIAAVFRRDVARIDPRLDVLIGPDDTGKSALLRTLASDYRAATRDFRFFDLSVTDYRQLIFNPDSVAETLIVDHIDRINDTEPFSAAFDLLDSVLPANLASGSLVLIISIGLDWRGAFRDIYRLNPETILQRANPSLVLRHHYIRPYDDAELTVLCHKLGLDPNDFGDRRLRRSGVLAMASDAKSEPRRLTGASLRDVLVMRWVHAGHDSSARQARKAIWTLMGTRTLRNGVFSIDLAKLYAELHGSFPTGTLSNQIGGPIRWEDDELQAESPSWSDVAAAKVLEGVIKRGTSVAIPVPMRSTVLDALIDLSNPTSLAGQVERRLITLQGSSFHTIGYLGAALATVLARVSSGPEVVLRNLYLQGPDHQQLVAVDSRIVETVQAALFSSLEESVSEVLAMLEHLVPSYTSGYRGGYEPWEAVRAWARSLPLRAAAENAISELLPHDGLWHYEDILDVSVTEATTRLMAGNAGAFSAALKSACSDPDEYLADIWDGINDGAWDQIDATSAEFVSSFKLPGTLQNILDIEGCQVQRARFGVQDASRWRLVNSDLFLADLRSCRNLESADLTGSNWWSAILPPAARYHLSRSCENEGFLEWCESPPWRNPYFSQSWPLPFG